MSEELSDIGLIGLAVMGQNLALNVADHGFRISVYNRTTSKTDKFVAENPDTPGGLLGMSSLKAFAASIKRPRKIIILVQAGGATDAVIESLLPHLDKDDIVVDGGNAKWTDTIRRESDLRRRDFRFVGSGVSGGEEGARFGPSLMPGGDLGAWKELEPIWTAIAAKVDAGTGKPLEGAKPGNPIEGGVPCTAYIGPKPLNRGTSLNAILTTGLCPPGTTVFQDIQELEPGCYLEYDLRSSRQQIQRYFDITSLVSKDEYLELAKLPAKELVSRHCDTFNQSIASHLISDAKLGVMFSAGLDSSLPRNGEPG